jgi:hypothetical protein
MDTNGAASDIHRAAVVHAALTRRAAELGWGHLQSEYSQDIPTVLATIEQNGPWTWTLPNSLPTSDGAAEYDGDQQPDTGLHYISATDMDQIREQYESMRDTVELWDWLSMTELRGAWYMVTQGVAMLRDVNSGDSFQLESATLFPVGEDGILGEVQIGNLANERVNRWPEVPTHPGEIPLPMKRVHATVLHTRLVDALRAEDVDGIVATMRPDVATAIRDYTTDPYTVSNTVGRDELAGYYRRLFERYRVREIQTVNRLVESWYVFSELHWTLEHRTGRRAGELIEFCTADLLPIDAEGTFWVRTGAGTDPVASNDTEAGTRPIAHERGPQRGWETVALAAEGRES